MQPIVKKLVRVGNGVAVLLNTETRLAADIHLGDRVLVYAEKDKIIMKKVK